MKVVVNLNWSNPSIIFSNIGKTPLTRFAALGIMFSHPYLNNIAIITKSRNTDSEIKKQS